MLLELKVVKMVKWSDVGNTLAPSVSGSLRAKPGCGFPAWQRRH